VAFGVAIRLCEGKIAIALGQRRGALFYQLCTHSNWIDLYPVNPHSLSSFRLTFFSSRAKDDPIDGQLLEELVRTHRDRLRPYQPEATTERKLYLYCRQRRSLLDLATKAELKLVSTLKQYFPVTVSLLPQYQSCIAKISHCVITRLRRSQQIWMLLKRQPANDRIEPELLARLRNSAKGPNYARPSGYPRMRYSLPAGRLPSFEKTGMGANKRFAFLVLW
jgi:Transposase